MIQEKTKIALFVMTRKGYHCLKHLIDTGKDDLIGAVISAKDEHLLKDYYEEIKELCEMNNIPFFYRSYDKDIPDVKFSYAIAISWRWLISGFKTIIVLHDSLLPYHRGFAPLPTMIQNECQKIGVTAIYANDEYDRGNIICQFSRQVNYPIKIEHAIDLILEPYENCIDFILKKDDGLIGTPQPEWGSYSVWLDEQDYQIDWSNSDYEIRQFIFSKGYPYRGASSFVEGKKVRILDCESYPDIQVINRDNHIGKVIFVSEGCPVIICKTGLLKLTELIDDTTRESILPLKKFRIRFK